MRHFKPCAQSTSSIISNIIPAKQHLLGLRPSTSNEFDTPALYSTCCFCRPLQAKDGAAAQPGHRPLHPRAGEDSRTRRWRGFRHGHAVKNYIWPTNPSKEHYGLLSGLVYRNDLKRRDLSVVAFSCMDFFLGGWGTPLHYSFKVFHWQRYNSGVWDIFFNNKCRELLFFLIDHQSVCKKKKKNCQWIYCFIFVYNCIRVLELCFFFSLSVHITWNYSLVC